MNEKIDKNCKNKNIKNQNNNILEQKLLSFQQIIINTIKSVKKYKQLEVYSANEANICLVNLNTIGRQLCDYLQILDSGDAFDSDEIISRLQEINNELSVLFKNFGTMYLEDLIIVCFGKDYINKYLHTDNDVINKYKLLKSFCHPLSYKVMNRNDGIKKSKIKNKNNKIIEDIVISDSSNNLDCFDISNHVKTFYSKVYGIKVVIQNLDEQKNIICFGLVDDVIKECVYNPFIADRLNALHNMRPNKPEFYDESFNNYIESLTLKDLLVNNINELYLKYTEFTSKITEIKQMPINEIVKQFLGGDLYFQRHMLISLLIKNDCSENQYMAYLLYDLLSNDNNGSIDTQEQVVLFDSLPWIIKKNFKNAMKKTIEYTHILSNYEQTTIPIEQQICLLKAPNSVKEKAMVKLKEIKAKSEDTGSKARQYLDGLLKIPLGIFKEEPILKITPLILNKFRDIITFIDSTSCLPPHNIEYRDTYTSMELNIHIPYLKNTYLPTALQNLKQHYIKLFTKGTRPTLIINIININTIIKKYKYPYKKIRYSNKKASTMREEITNFIQQISNVTHLNDLSVIKGDGEFYKNLNLLKNNIDDLSKDKDSVKTYINNVHDVLDKSIYGHEKAKRSIEQIIGQWINGEKTGYCIGFEGPPGVGKTSLAKQGIKHCLIDQDGTSRPFGFVAVGGGANGSMIDGHNYTYVGSTWGRIVDILIESKCMNPIIFIDELDKISKTEHGKEIIGIFTHMTDSTQNEVWQDKYFSGIDIDISKALIIFSYNNPDDIDRILLDRIHRIKFEYLSPAEKIVIANKYILPQLYKTFGVENTIQFEDGAIEYIIQTFTIEPGVRKLKEILYEIVSEINLKILYNSEYTELPIIVNQEDIYNKFLKNRHALILKKIHKQNTVALITGLWANNYGMGGILPIEGKLYPADKFLELKLTGMQGDVMKESMGVAKTLACSLVDNDKLVDIKKNLGETGIQGIHIHVPEGATPKDGPSAGTAITIALYSLLTNQKINHKIAITGEICLQGLVTAIGGLDLKILGGIKSGVKIFIFPKENSHDYNKLREKYKDSNMFDNIEFHQVEHISEVIDLVIEK